MMPPLRTLTAPAAPASRAATLRPRYAAWPIFVFSLGALIAVVAGGDRTMAAPVLPSGGVVAAGGAVIEAPTATGLTISQSTPKAVIDWSSFSIGQGGAVQFNNGSGVTLNRITGGGGSQIDGLLSATGSVFLLNPNGVIISRSGAVAVGGGFVVSTLGLSNEQFLADGPLTFAGSSTAQVVNAGSIRAGTGDAILIAATVENDGRIDAAQGDAGLAAGHEVTLSTVNGGAGKLSVTLGGADTAVTNAGLITAASAELRANGGNVYALAVNTDGGIKVSGVTETDGKVYLVADGGAVTAQGEIDATTAGGHGGLVETSGATVDFTGVRVRAGTWLIDPTTLTVDAAAASTIAANLATTNVTLHTTAGSATGPGVQSAGAGDILVDAPITWSSANTLSLDAYHSVVFNADVAVAGAGKVVLTTNDGGSGGGYVFAPDASLSFTGTPGAGQALTINGQAYELVYSQADLLNINNALGGDYALATSLDLLDSAFGGAPIAPLVSQPFTGVFTGLGNTIGHLHVNQQIPILQVASTGYATNGAVGLFGWVGQGGRVEHIRLVDAQVFGGDGMQVGALVGSLGGSVIDATTSGDVGVGSGVNTTSGFAYASAGGVVGGSVGTIRDSQSSATVEGDNAFAGGLLGSTSAGAAVLNSHASGNVSVGSAPGGLEIPTAGGLVGVLYGNQFGGNNPLPTSVTGSYATGDVVGGGGVYVGGLIGTVTQAQVTTSYATGTVTANAPGQNGALNFAGGFVGLVGAGGSVTQSWASGAVFVVGGPANLQSSFGGGFVGDVNASANINNAYALGPVTASGSAFVLSGGFAGLVASGASVDHVYATGFVSGTGGLAGLVGLLGNSLATDTSGFLSDSYWDEGTTGRTNGYILNGTGSASNVVGLGGSTGLGVYNPANYANLDLVSTWFMVAGKTRPILRSEYSASITNAHQLQLMALNLSGAYVLANDISAVETTTANGVWNPANGFVPVGPTPSASFTGSLDGGGHSISNLRIRTAAGAAQTNYGGFVQTGFAGLFGAVGVNGHIFDLDLDNVDIVGGDGVLTGALAGGFLGRADNVSSSGSVTGGNGVLTGLGFATVGVGGLVGALDGAINTSHSSATVTGGNADAGGLVGVTAAVPGVPAGSITDSYATGAVTVGGYPAGADANPTAGGLVGFLDGYAFGDVNPVPLTVSGSYATGAVSGGGGSFVGGFAGLVVQSTITTSFATGAAIQTAGGQNGNVDWIGGFAGAVADNSSITQSWSSGAVTTIGGPDSGHSSIAGGFAGEANASATLSFDYALGAVSSSGSGFAVEGGFVGLLQTSAAADQVYATGLVSGTGFKGGLAGFVQSSAALSNGYWDEGATGQTTGYTTSTGGTATNVTGIGGATGLNVYAPSTYATFNLATNWYMVAGETRPILRAEHSSVVTNAHQLQLMALNPSGHFVLGADIDASETTSVHGVWNPANGFVPVGSSLATPFSGVLDGDGHAISNLTIIGATPLTQATPLFSTDGALGLFGFVAPGGVVENLSLQNVHVAGLDGMIVGAVAGQLSGQIHDVTASGVVTTGSSETGSRTAAAGGLVGDMGDSNGDGVIQNSSSSVTVGGVNAYVGGLVGWAHNGASIAQSDATGAVAVGNRPGGSPPATPAAGGLIGVSQGSASHPVTVSDAYATGAVAGGSGSTVGGFAGSVDQTNITSAYATGAVAQTSGQAGGFAGNSNAGTISRAFASGPVTTGGAGSAAGGFVGVAQTGVIQDAYATGQVTLTSGLGYVGGFAGIIQLGASANRVFAAGLVTGAGSVGGLAGDVGSNPTGAILNSYWDEGATGRANAIGSGSGTLTNVVGMGGATGINPYAAVTYAGWNFSTVWAPPSAGDYPRLYGVSHVINLITNSVSSAYGSFPVYAFTLIGLQDGDTTDVLEADAFNQGGGSTAASGFHNVGSTSIGFASATATGVTGAYKVIRTDGVLTVTPKVLTASLGGSVSKSYDGGVTANLSAATYNLQGVIGPDVVSLNTPATGVFSSKNVGTGIGVSASGLSLLGAGASNYTVNTTATSAIGVITPRPLTLAAVSDTKTYDGGTASSASPTATGLVGGDTISNLGEHYDAKTVGSRTLTINAGYVISDGAGGGNYTVTLSTAAGSITPKLLTASLTGHADKFYDGSIIATLTPGNYSLAGVVSGDVVVLNDPTNGSYDTPDVGTGKSVSVAGLALSGADAGNYTVNATATGPIGAINASQPPIQTTIIVNSPATTLASIAPPPAQETPTTPAAAAATTATEPQAALAPAAADEALAADASSDPSASATDSPEVSSASVFAVGRGAARPKAAVDTSPVAGGGNRDLWTGSDAGSPGCAPSDPSSPSCPGAREARP
jgi:mucin-19